MFESKTIDELKKETTIEIIAYSVAFIILLTIMIIFMRKSFFFIIFIFSIVFLFLSINSILKFLSITKLKKQLIKNDLLDEIGSIEYVYKRRYYLTNKYIIIHHHKNYIPISYYDIKSVQKEVYYESSFNENNQVRESIHEYVYIALNDNTIYKIDNESPLETEDSYKDVIEYLRTKNHTITVLEPEVTYNRV